MSKTGQARNRGIRRHGWKENKKRTGVERGQRLKENDVKGGHGWIENKNGKRQMEKGHPKDEEGRDGEEGG